ncbi:MAG: hypothetical protein HY247_06625 [archaeon]|nr:MAG: hypothetical protein HY247_06625 [archaeon]
MNIYTSATTINTDLRVLPMLSGSTVDPWFQFGVPAELAISIALLIAGLLQLLTVSGLWFGRKYSYYMALILPVVILAVNLTYALLTYSAPESLGLRDSTQWSYVVSGVFWVAIYWNYLRKPRVKAYLKVGLDPGPKQVPAAMSSSAPS